MSQNKSIVEKSQQILEEYGYKVKTGHLYELFSKLAKESSWNVAKAKGILFSEKINIEPGSVVGQELNDLSKNDGIISPEEARATVSEAKKLKLKQLLIELKKQLNSSFKQSGGEFTLDKSWFNSFNEVDGIEELQSFLAHLESLGYLLDPNPKDSKMTITFKKEKKEFCVDFHNFLISQKKDAVDVRNFIKDYEQKIKDHAFKGLVTYGVKDDGLYLARNPFEQPGSLFVGGMGSGKSVSGFFTAVTHKLSNSENSLYFFVDTLTNAMDFKLLWDDTLGYNKTNTIGVIKTEEKVVELIDFLYNEAMARKDLLSKGDFSSVREYNQKHKTVAEIHIFIENFHSIPNSPLIKFHMNVDKIDSTAFKLKTLSRIGRSYGIFFNLLSQRATYEDVPGGIKPGIANMMCFKMNNPGDAVAMNLPHAKEISVEQRGRCAYEEGFLQFPYLSQEIAAVLISKYDKPLKAKLLTAKVSELQKKLK